ncbi:hypothetical protein [Flavobacterium sp. '19STA2R22 D10 B1']|uniref:hypothetical protein n=1 Tax=Flavobacterium aerium TaxID=3037261 RepID=UPI00278C45AE|nr:hypothetical protein [Flavobacterium sp. '19STA2R22 D10 B1']
MKKKAFTLELRNPCTENLDGMTKNSQGFYCDSCKKNVLDFTEKTDQEITTIVSSMNGASFCAKLRPYHLEQNFEYYEENNNSLKYAAAMAASVLLASGVSAQSQKAVHQTEQASVLKNDTEKLNPNFEKKTEKERSVLLKGRLIDSRTNLPLDAKKYNNITLRIDSSQQTINVKAASGEFILPMKLQPNQKSVTIEIYANDYNGTKQIELNLKNLKGSTLVQNIKINPEKELFQAVIAGGIGMVPVVKDPPKKVTITLGRIKAVPPTSEEIKLKSKE